MIKDLEFLFKKIFFSEKYLLEKRLKRAIKKNYEKELEVIDRYSDKSKDALDIGVYRGVYSYKLSQNFKTVHSFEPNPLLYPYLKKNLKKVINNMILYNLALSDTNGQSELKLPIRSKSIFKDNIEELFKLGAATMHPKNTIENFKKVPIKIKKLDDIEINNKIGFIKIDVEGHEKNVLMGGLNTIKNNKPILLIEIEEKHSKVPIEDTINFMKKYDYNPYVYINKKLIDFDLRDKKQKEINYIFIHK
jgi:FkbM family methyltransferase